MLLKGLTHALVHVNSYDGFKQTGISAAIELCFGEGDDNLIGKIFYIKNPDRDMVFQLPYNGPAEIPPKFIYGPVFKGLVAEEITKYAARAVDRIKTVHGKPVLGKSYRVAGDKVEVIGEAEILP